LVSASLPTTLSRFFAHGDAEDGETACGEAQEPEDGGAGGPADVFGL